MVAQQGSGRPEVFKSPFLKALLLLYGLVAAFTGPLMAIYTIPLLIFHGLRRRRLPIRLFWLCLPVLL